MFSFDTNMYRSLIRVHCRLSAPHLQTVHTWTMATMPTTHRPPSTARWDNRWHSDTSAMLTDLRLAASSICVANHPTRSKDRSHSSNFRAKHVDSSGPMTLLSVHYPFQCRVSLSLSGTPLLLLCVADRFPATQRDMLAWCAAQRRFSSPLRPSLR